MIHFLFQTPSVRSIPVKLNRCTTLRNACVIEKKYVKFCALHPTGIIKSFPIWSLYRNCYSLMTRLSIASWKINSRDEMRASHFTGRSLRSGIESVWSMAWRFILFSGMLPPEKEPPAQAAKQWKKNYSTNRELMSKVSCPGANVTVKAVRTSH